MALKTCNSEPRAERESALTDAVWPLPSPLLVAPVTRRLVETSASSEATPSLNDQQPAANPEEFEEALGRLQAAAIAKHSEISAEREAAAIAKHSEISAEREALNADGSR